MMSWFFVFLFVFLVLVFFCVLICFKTLVDMTDFIEDCFLIRDFEIES